MSQKLCTAVQGQSVSVPSTLNSCTCLEWDTECHAKFL